MWVWALNIDFGNLLCAELCREIQKNANSLRPRSAWLRVRRSKQLKDRTCYSSIFQSTQSIRWLPNRTDFRSKCQFLSRGLPIVWQFREYSQSPPFGPLGAKRRKAFLWITKAFVIQNSSATITLCGFQSAVKRRYMENSENTFEKCITNWHDWKAAKF